MLKTKGFLLVLAVLLLCATGWTQYGQRQAAQAPGWYYRTIRVTHTELFGSPTFKAQGDQGWELVTAVYVEHERAAYYTFKRAK